VERIVSAFLARFEYDFLAERQRVLRALYRHNHGRQLGPVVPTEKVGRNDPCPCGSGKKYKKCCGR
jgi:preprotein translocase subunit SecA